MPWRPFFSYSVEIQIQSFHNMPNLSAHTSTRTWASSAPLCCWDMKRVGNAPWEQSFWPLHELLLNKPTVVRQSLLNHPSSGLWGARLCFIHSNNNFFFLLLLIPSPNFLKNSCKIPWGIAHGRGQPFPGQLKYIILILYSKFSCPLVSPHDVRAGRLTQHWSHSTHGAASTNKSVNKSSAGIRKGHILCCPQPSQPGALLVCVHHCGATSGKTTGRCGLFFTGGFSSGSLLHHPDNWI